MKTKNSKTEWIESNAMACLRLCSPYYSNLHNICIKNMTIWMGLVMEKGKGHVDFFGANWIIKRVNIIQQFYLGR